MNVISLIGNIGRDSETRFTQLGDAITSFSVALTSGYGEKKITTWLNASIFGKRGESLAPYLKKGTQVGISGEFQARPYTTKDGVEKLSLEVRVNDVTLVGGKKDSAPQDSHNEAKSNGFVKHSTGDDFDSDVPF